MFLWLTMSALAAPRPGWLEMPVTPSHPTIRDYIGLAKSPKDGGTEWVSDNPYFRCAGGGKYVEVTVEADNWPSVIPPKVTCTEVGRGRTTSLRVDIISRKHIPMFVTDGTLVMPRLKNSSASFEGPPPRADVVVGQGRTGELGIRCAVEAGPTLSVIVDTEEPDGEGECSLRTTSGETLLFPIRIVTVK